MANLSSARTGSWFCLGPSESPVVQFVALLLENLLSDGLWGCFILTRGKYGDLGLSPILLSPAWSHHPEQLQGQQWLWDAQDKQERDLFVSHPKDQGHVLIPLLFASSIGSSAAFPNWV